MDSDDISSGRSAGGAPPSARSKSIAEFYRTSAYAAFEQEHRVGGPFDLEMMDVHQSALEIVDPAVPQVIFSNARGEGFGEVDIGDGWRRTRFSPDGIDVQPAQHAVGFRVPALHVRAVAVPKLALDDLLERTGAPPDALDALAGRFEPLPRARRIIASLWEAAAGHGAAASLLIDGHFMTLVGELLHAVGRGAEASDLGELDDARLRRAIDYVEAHLGEPLSIGELATVASMSAPGFARAFRNATGRPVWAHVQRRRAERARELLLRTDLSIVAIALGCGFSSQSHLTNLFRRRFGTTPARCRREAMR